MPYTSACTRICHAAAEPVLLVRVCKHTICCVHGAPFLASTGQDSGHAETHNVSLQNPQHMLSGMLLPSMAAPNNSPECTVDRIQVLLLLLLKGIHKLLHNE